MSKFSLSFNQYITVRKMEPFYDSYFNSLKYLSKFKITNTEEHDFNFDRSIILKNVTFKYKFNTILENINLEINKGSFTSIMGKSGSGKTTIIDLLLNLLEPSSGDIFIDNKNLNLIDKNKWRTLVGCITQEHYFFNDSIYNNLTLGSDKYSDDQIKEILQLSLCDDFIKPNDDLKKIFMGESGSKFSGGQKQRLSIARALLRIPSIILLDEATSALDNENEQKLLYNLKNNLGYKATIILITHNKDIIKYSDHSYCIKNNQLYNITNEIK